MSSDFTFQFTQGFSNIYEGKWGNIKVSSSDTYILIAFLSLYLKQYFKKHIIITLWTTNLFQGAAPHFELGKLCLAWHRDLLLTCWCSYPHSIRAHKKKVKSFEMLLPQKVLELWMKLSCTFELHLPFSFDASRISRKTCFKRHAFGCYRANWSKVY